LSIGRLGLLSECEFVDVSKMLCNWGHSLWACPTYYLNEVLLRKEIRKSLFFLVWIALQRIWMMELPLAH